MSFSVRLIPKWTQLASRLAKTIQEKEQQDHNGGEGPLYLDVHPSVQFHCPCAPTDHLQCITAYTGHSGNVVLGFQWGQTVFKHQIHMWLDDGQGNLRLHSSTPVCGRYRVERMLFVPSQHMLVASCSDLQLRVLTDNTQEMVVLYSTPSPAAVSSMHYCQETNELLTGSMGLIAFWGFWTSAQTPLSLLRILDWTRCSLRRETVVSAFVSQRQTNSIYALCDRSVKNFEHTGQSEIFEFRGRSSATLRCVVPEWRQRYLYTGDADGYVQVWSCDIRRLFLQFRAHATAVTAIALLAETRSILTASAGCWLKQWTRGGDLLLKLHLDTAGGVRSMWPLSSNTVMCQSAAVLDVWRLNSVYRSFNDTACAVRVLRRVECCRGKGRILAVTLDGIIRFLSPVTGELLFLSWPFLHIDKALGFAYEPAQEELYLCDGGVEVLVLNTTLSPCPVKRVINAAKDGNDGVLCLETVAVWGAGGGTGGGAGGGAGDERPLRLLFSGHRNGKLQLLAPLRVFCEPQKAHNGAIAQMSSLSGETPSVCCYGTDGLFTVWSVRLDRCEVVLTLAGQISCDFVPVHHTLMEDVVCAVSPQQHLIFYSVHGDVVTESERRKSERISCLDYCPQLALLALTGDSGKIEIWTRQGDLVAEIQLGVPVTQLCFGNARGDILASFADSISIISATHVLPASYLRTVLGQAPVDDIVELPIPFLPKSPLHYDIGKVPKIYLKHLKRTKENIMIEPPPDQATIEDLLEGVSPKEQKEQISKSVLIPYFPSARRTTVFRTAENTQPTLPELEPGEPSDAPSEALIQRKRSEEDFLSLFRRIAPDGYIPNSVVRAIRVEEDEDEEEEEEEVEEEEEYVESVLPTGLLRDFEEKEDASVHTQAVQDILTRAKVKRMADAVHTVIKHEHTSHEETPVPEEEIQEPEETEEERRQRVYVSQKVDSLLGQLNATCRSSYKEYCRKLMKLIRKQSVTPSQLEQVKEKLVCHVQDATLEWRQQEGMRTLHLMQLLHSSDVSLISTFSTFLVNPDPELRSLVRSSLRNTFHISEKQALRNELQDKMSATTLEPLLDKLSDDLTLKENADDDQTSSNTTEQHLKVKDMKGSKTSHSSSSIEPENLQRDVTQMSDYNDSRKVRRSTKRIKGTAKVSKEQANSSRTKAKRTELQADMFESTRTTLRPSPEPAGKRERGVHPPSKKHHLKDVEREAPAPKDPLLYAFRKARKYGSATSPPVDKHESPLLPSRPVDKHESRLLPSDSGLGSFMSQEVSSDMVSFGGRSGGTLSITKSDQLISKSQPISKLDQLISIPQPISKPDKLIPKLQPISKPDKHIPKPQEFISLPISKPKKLIFIPQPISKLDQLISTPQPISKPGQLISKPQPISKLDKLISKPQDFISQQPQHASQYFHYTSQDSEHISQHPHYVSQHHDYISQHPHYVSQHHDYISQHPQYISEHHDYISQHPQYIPEHHDYISQHPQYISEHHDYISQHPQYISEHHDYISQHPQRVHKQPGHMARHAGLAVAVEASCERAVAVEASCERALAVEASCERAWVPGDWRESLHTLIALHGFRSQKAARAVASLCAQPLALRARDVGRTRTLPPLLPRPPCQGALGERVAQRTEYRHAGEGAMTTRFQHKLPLPWRLGHFPLHPHGQVRYGRLHMHWVRTHDELLGQTDRVTLPKINPNSSHVQA